MLLILQLTGVYILAVSGETQTHRLVKIYDEADIAQDIVHDVEENTVAITVSQTPALEKFVPTVNFHDFNTNYVVFKDIERGTCLLTHPPIPFATPNVYKLKRTDVTLTFKSNVNNKQLDNEEVKEKAGEKISDFCQDYKTFWMDLTPKHNNEPIKREADEPEPCIAGCGICIVELAPEYKESPPVDIIG
ncbi:uncharacterized protein LOC128552233 [Mercenaria mercenaria]|uniref:uncharacterized protein LOC128552233 n=1 Tax=Mercenaria mercenaria TaxID=6596 RepID=UPI00234EF68F|nr:uncharacterized protein LOC128552233 [Mercenaria mercenaria]